MHIVCIISSLQKGGSERVMSNLANYLILQGHQVTFITQYKKNEEYSLNSKIMRIISQISEDETGNSRIINFIRRLRKLQNILKSSKPDVILSFIGKNNFMALLAAQKLHIPVVVSVRADPNQEYPNRWMRFMARRLFGNAAGVILQTKECMNFFPTAVRQKAVILHNPVNEVFFENPYNGEHEHTIVSVGRLDKNKNQALLLRAFAPIAEDYPDYRIIFYGKGDQEDTLKELAYSLGIANRVTFAGSVPDVAEQIKKANIFVMTSNSEGVPNALLEAMALGIPVISTDCPCGGPKELIHHGENGLLTPVENIEKLQESIQYLLDNPCEAYKMGENARKTAQLYHPDIVYREWEEYLCGISKKC